MLHDTLPLISCIMPTYNRREFVPNAIRYFLRQDYESKELIIIDDGTDPVADLIPDAPRIRYFRLDRKITLGAKLNMACRYAEGSVIANWDDDDWYASNRLSYQVTSLQNEHKDVCGINHLLYYDLRDKNAYKYTYPPNRRIWLLGSSLCYTKAIWKNNPFADINVGMDGLFVWRLSAERVMALPDHTFSVHMIHNGNVSPKKTGGSWWQAYPAEKLKEMLGEDWSSYHRNGKAWYHIEETLPQVKMNDHQEKEIVRNVKLTKLKNIYACLVHENEECVIDMVRNLHYHDPEGSILLYNGGDKPNLLTNHFPYEKFGAFIHPLPTPTKWGYLHNFALDCMQFALENFSFDILTIVDSDQLACRSGYTNHVGKFLAGHQGRIGMLSSMQQRVKKDDKHVHAAMQAFKEYDLWKPLLQAFPEGESKFLHWTFWPSTVFTADAARDLCRLFKTNKILQEVMGKTKIWATEEVVLPTLIKLLGYDIALNPCSYEFVKYKRKYNTGDVEQALRKQDAYWIHPITRHYDDPLRTYARQLFNHYTAGDKLVSLDNSSVPTFITSSVLNSVKNIEGWLDMHEGELLISSILKACIEQEAPHHIVEVGSYQGKSTILLGSVVKAYFPAAKVYAIDPHEGVVGATDQGLQLLPPSLVMFNKNIESAGVSGHIETIVDFSYNVRWDKPISLLFIDGLHDYPNVARDFWHFSDWVKQGGYIAFHDYADYYPGVQAFVNELLNMGSYRKIQHVKSLIVIQKTADNR